MKWKLLRQILKISKYALFGILLQAFLMGTLLAETNTKKYRIPRTDILVSGQVISADGNEPLPGVNVVVKGTPTGTVTDIDGNYQLEVPEGATLAFSYIGYQTKEVVVTNQTTLNVSLDVDFNQLDEIVVIGYGTTTEKELTAAVSTIKSDEITKLSPTRVENALQGQVAGIQISSGSGSPGGDQNIRIRGINSNGDNRPLIIVDGIRYGDDLNTIDPNVIESITVLKDASSAIYGVLAANGVIIVTTKSGKGLLKPKFSVGAYYGIQETERKINLLNATEYALLTNEAFVAGGSSPLFTNVSALGQGTDWQDEVFEPASIQNYNMNYRGSSDKGTYSLGGSFFSQEGIVGGDKSQFDRVNLNMNVTRELYKNLKLTTNLNYIHVRRKTLPENNLGSVLFNALNIAPTEPVFDQDGNFTEAENLGIEIINPLAQIVAQNNDTGNNRFSGLLALNYEIMEGLSVESSFNFNYANVAFKEFNPAISFGTDKVFNSTFSAVTERSEIFASYNVDNIIRYDVMAGKDTDHSLQITLGNSIFQNIGTSLTVTGRNIPNNSALFADISEAQEFDENNAASSFEFDTRQLSYFGRVEYKYDNRYLFSALLRRDATSIFAPGNQVGYFYALSGGWVFSEESAFSLPDFIDFGKLRVSFGEVGNDRVDAFGFIATLNGEAEAVFDGGDIVQGAATGKLPNPDLSWERTSQFDIGLDLDFFEGRIGLVADYYLKTTNDLLIEEVPSSGLTGIAAPGGLGPSVNAGKVRNRGFEVALSFNEELTKNLSISASINFANNFNETLAVNDNSTPIFRGTFGVGGDADISRFQQGLPVGAYWGLKTDGIFQTLEEVASSAQAGRAQPGDLRFVDLNGDGQINNDDRTMIGSPIPENIMGFNLGLNYKNFDFSTLWESQTGHQLVRNYERDLPRVNERKEAIERWAGAGTSNTFPRLTTGATDNNLFSDFYVEDGDYLRIRNIQLGYTLPTDVVGKIGATKARFYASVNNVFTFTNYNGFDPSGARSFNPDSNEGALNVTNDIGFYPLPRTYILGFNLTF